VPGRYRIVLNTDAQEFGGHNRLDQSVDFFTQEHPWHDRSRSMLIYLPCRTAVVFALQA